MGSVDSGQRTEVDRLAAARFTSPRRNDGPKPVDLSLSDTPKYGVRTDRKSGKNSGIIWGRDRNLVRECAVGKDGIGSVPVVPH